MTLSLPFSFTDLRTELDLGTGTMNCAVDIPATALNDCSSGGDNTLPIVFTTFNTYNHDAQPAAPVLTIGTGDDASPTDDPQQDSHIYLTWPPITCAATYDVEHSTAGSGGPFSVISNNQSDEFLVVDIGAPATSRHYRILATSIVNGPYSSVVEGRTCPNQPQELGSSSDDDCDDLNITISWTNGTSPGTRISKVEWRWYKVSGSFTGAFLGPTAAGATSFVQNVGGGHSDSDQWNFEIRYEDEGGTTVTKTFTVTCFA
jgi:hypothetical protein